MKDLPDQLTEIADAITRHPVQADIIRNGAHKLRHLAEVIETLRLELLSIMRSNTENVQVLIDAIAAAKAKAKTPEEQAALDLAKAAAEKEVPDPNPGT